MPQDWVIVVLVDRDDDNCITLKTDLEDIASGAKLLTRTAAGTTRYRLVNRIAIEELEAWHFGDWKAVRTAYARVARDIPRKAAYRDPDAIKGGTCEAFERILQRAGYFQGGLRKIEAAQAVAAHWNVDSNTSRSFRVTRDILREIARR